MRKSKIWTLFRKELDDGLRSKYVALSVIFMPFIFAVFMPLSSLIPLIGSSPTDFDQDIASFSKFAFTSDWTDLNGLQQFFILSVEFNNVLFLLLPMMLPTIIAADSFVGEKDRGTVEALLSAPITDGEIYMGKILGSLVPSIIGLLISSIPYILIVNYASIRILNRYYLPNLIFFFLIFVYGPLLSLASSNFMIWVSTRTNSTRDAQQLGGIIVIPQLLFVAMIYLTVIIFSPLFFYFGMILLIAIDYALVKIGIGILDRDRWITN